MKNPWSTLLLLLILVFTYATIHGAVPPINVTVSDANGKVAFKGTTNASGAFSTTKLKPGKYVVQFASKDTATKADHYSIVVSAGEQKISADAISAEKLSGAGVAMKINVGISIAKVIKEHPGLNNPAAIRAMERDNEGANFQITGQVTMGSN